jgi:hypothetical protein
MITAEEARRLMIVARAEKIPEIFALIKNAMYNGLDMIEVNLKEEASQTLRNLGYTVNQLDREGNCRVIW